MRKTLLLLVVLVLCGCSSHWFKHRLLVERAVPHLKFAEWKEIAAQFELKKEFQFVEARRTAADLVEVTLEDVSDRYSGICVFFAFEDGHWVEKPELATEWVIVGKEHQS